ncbi:MAG: zinc metallopeptidase [Deltaproteobacteria bacterium]|nr:zinc metallopeptidase [Deltaproteobacteria bacterium]
MAKTSDQNGPAVPEDTGSTTFLDPFAGHVEIVPLGDVDGVAVSVAAANLQAVLGLPADVLPARADPDYALIPARRQYDALPILREIQAGMPDKSVRLGILSGDLCLPIFSYVLGEAQVKGRAAVISLFRLKQGREGRPCTPSRIYERVAKVALHETAHVLGLTHCREEGCLMRFSLGVEHIDELAMRFCPVCELRLLRGRRGAS